MNRIVEKFSALKREGRKAFIVYIGAGDPNLEATRKLGLAFDRRLGNCSSVWLERRKSRHIDRLTALIEISRTHDNR